MRNYKIYSNLIAFITEIFVITIVGKIIITKQTIKVPIFNIKNENKSNEIGTEFM